MGVERIEIAHKLEEWVEAYRLAWEDKDAEAVAVLFTHNGTYRSNIFEDAHQGREDIAEYWRSVTSVQSQVRVRMGTPFVDGSRVAVEFWTNMNVNDEVVTLPGCLLLEFTENWRCTSLREYWHYQPGSYDPPGGWGE